MLTTNVATDLYNCTGHCRIAEPQYNDHLVLEGVYWLYIHGQEAFVHSGGFCQWGLILTTKLTYSYLCTWLQWVFPPSLPPSEEFSSACKWPNRIATLHTQMNLYLGGQDNRGTGSLLKKTTKNKKLSYNVHHFLVVPSVQDRGNKNGWSKACLHGNIHKFSPLQGSWYTLPCTNRHDPL